MSPGTEQGSCLVIHKSLQASDDLTTVPYPIGAVRKAISQLPNLQNKIHALSPPELLSRALTRRDPTLIASYREKTGESLLMQKTTRLSSDTAHIHIAMNCLPIHTGIPQLYPKQGSQHVFK